MTRYPFFDDREDAVLDGIVDGLVDDERARAELDAQSVLRFAAAMRVGLARLADKPRSTQEREMAIRSIAAEIAVRLRWHDRTVQNRMNEALRLVDDFPATLDALAAGRISARHASVIRHEAPVVNDAAVLAVYEETVLERAVRDTVSRTEVYAKQVAEELNPVSITERFRTAVESRRVWMQDLGDGMGELGVIAPITTVRAMHDRLTQQAHTLRAATPPVVDSPAGDLPVVERAKRDETRGAHAESVHDTRTIDQTRADLLTDLILTGQPATDPLAGGLGAIRATVQITVPALTAAGASDRGATIDGLSPIDADTARDLLAGADRVWDRILTHPITGLVLATDSYRVTPTMHRYLQARDVHCRFPGCRRPARVCEHDHNVDWARGGKTEAGNMAMLCTRHHTLKTETEWSAKQLPDGSIEWTSPLGHRTADPPERHSRVVFVPEAEPPPF
jgi:hypothetical protein